MTVKGPLTIFLEHGLDCPEKDEAIRRFKAYRESAGCETQESLANLTGIGLKNIQNWEQGVARPSGKYMRTLTKFGDISLLIGERTTHGGEEQKGETMTTIQGGAPPRTLAEAAAIIAECMGKPGFSAEDLAEALVALKKQRAEEAKEASSAGSTRAAN